MQQGSSWGWATWKRTWDLFEEDAQKLNYKLKESEKLERFNYEGDGIFENMLINQIEGRVDSWAIRFYASLVLHNKLNFAPKVSLAQNIGADGSGIHSGVSSAWDVSLYEESIPVERIPIVENNEFREAYKKLLRENFSKKN